MTWFTRSLARHKAAERNRREAAHLAALPEYLLRDMGLTLDGEAALARHLLKTNGQ